MDLQPERELKTTELHGSSFKRENDDSTRTAVLKGSEQSLLKSPAVNQQNF